MLFEINNIATIKTARIEMRGVTVLAGNNSTGKSTFGKVLFCIFNAFYDSGKEIMKERKNSIEDIFIRFNHSSSLPSLKISRLADTILNKLNSPQEISQIIRNAIEQRIIIPPGTDEAVDLLLKKICDYAKISDAQIQKRILEYYLEAGFDGQVTHINQPQQEGKISLSFKDEQFRLDARVSKKECLEYTGNAGITARVFYVDTPFVLDDVNHRRHGRFYN